MMLFSPKMKRVFLHFLLSTSSLVIQTTATTATKTLFTGDSDIEGWSTSSKFPNSVNKGVGGYTCQQVNQEINNHLNKYEPEWVVLVCGENDLFSQTVTQTFNDFMDVVNAIVASGARVVYMGTKPEPGTTVLHSNYRSYDAKIRTKAVEMAETSTSSQKSPPLVMVDVYPVFKTIEETDPGVLYQDDNLHLSEVGYSYWNTWATTALANYNELCIRWKGNECAEESNGGPPPSDSVIVGGAGVNVCPSGYQKIESETGCNAAMILLGKSENNGSEDEAEWPSKCYFCDNVDGCTNGVWFNKHNTGSARTGARPICALPGWEEDNVCENDNNWIFINAKGNQKNCDWVGKKNKRVRCRKTGNDDRDASEACRHSCLGNGSSCDTGCLDDTNWLFRNRRGQKKTCKWVDKLPNKRCKKVGLDTRLASEACLVSCSDHGSQCQ